MRFLVTLMGAVGMTLFATGLPFLRRLTLGDKVAAHLPGAAAPSSVSPENWVQRLAARVPGHDESLGQRLRNAGLDMSPLALRAEQIAWGALSLAAVAFLSILSASFGMLVDPITVPILAVLAFASGFYARDWWLGRQVQMRRGQLKEELPTAIDMLTLALIAGESPGAAMQRVAGAVRGSVGDEFDRIIGDVRSGEAFLDALQRAKDRAPEHSLARFLEALTTGIEKGSPLGDVLRGQADEARHARGREMVEAAGRKEVLMLVPVVFLIMPVVVVYALFPGLASLDLFVR